MRIQWIIALLMCANLFGQNGDSRFFDDIAVPFAGKRGQVEVGGNFAGAAFHHSRPLPSRISFFYPVANSLDLSTDYWKRDESQPVRATLSADGQSWQLENISFSYRCTPFAAVFSEQLGDLQVQIEYQFCADIPALALSFVIVNAGEHPVSPELQLSLQPVLRTCQTYAWKYPADISRDSKTRTVVAKFPDADADSAALFVANVAGNPAEIAVSQDSANPQIRFDFAKHLAPGDSLAFTQLIGTCRMREADSLIANARSQWQNSIAANEMYVKNAVETGDFRQPDSAFSQTLDWSKAVLASNRHWLDGAVVPMPCPAEYNFFFTHDLLLTDLGAVMFDTPRVKRDLQYLQSLTQPDSILPHAYYWRDGGYQTEFCATDNWNHLWFIIVSGSYLRHSGDAQTCAAIFPMLQKSLSMMLHNRGADNLSVATRPDWWDIGNVSAARVYTTALTIRAIREYAAIARKLSREGERLPELLAIAESMRQSLIEKCWDNERGFLMSMRDSVNADHHYYAGSLVAAVFDLLDDQQKITLLETARRELLDTEIGLRIAMPADFHTMIEQYKFNGMEAGEPFVYLNGGIWPHGNVWYALGWLMAGKPDVAGDALRKYATLSGVAASPNGQPSFYEYRKANRDLPEYGQIDKPTFLWSGGWFINALYQLAGVRENPENIAFSPNLPAGWTDIGYDLQLFGSAAKVSYRGDGDYFSGIFIDGKPAHSAVFSQPADSVRLVRGTPKSPYLANANCRIQSVDFDNSAKQMQIFAAGIPRTTATFSIVSPMKPNACRDRVSGKSLAMEVQSRGDVFVVNIDFPAQQNLSLVLLFDK